MYLDTVALASLQWGPPLEHGGMHGEGSLVVEGH